MPAPLIAAAFAALAPTLAQQGLGLLSNVFSGVASAGTAKVAALIEEKTGIDIADIAGNRLDEDDWERLRQFESANTPEILAAQLELDRNALERERIASTDRRDARAMQIQVFSQEDRYASSFLYLLTLVMVVLTFGFLFYAAFWYPADTGAGNKALAESVGQTLLTLVLGGVMYFFFGSSTGSKAKERRAVDGEPK